jgi:hypothetical protein
MPRRLLTLFVVFAYLHGSATAAYACLTTTKDGAVVLESHGDHLRKWHLGGSTCETPSLRESQGPSNDATDHGHLKLMGDASTRADVDATAPKCAPPMFVPFDFASVETCGAAKADERRKPPSDLSHRSRRAAHADVVLVL